MAAIGQELAFQLGRQEADAAGEPGRLIERDGGLAGPRGAAARDLLYLFEKDAAVATLRGG